MKKSEQIEIIEREIKKSRYFYEENGDVVISDELLETACLRHKATKEEMKEVLHKVIIEKRKKI